MEDHRIPVKISIGSKIILVDLNWKKTLKIFTKTTLLILGSSNSKKTFIQLLMATFVKHQTQSIQIKQ